MPNDRQFEFAELIANHQSQIYGYLRAMVRSVEDAQDLHQQTLTVLWRKFDQFEPGTNFLAWALRVAELELRSFRRKRTLVTGLGEEVLSQLATVMQAEADAGDLQDRKSALDHCLEKLSGEDRSLIRQAYLEEQQIQRIAKQLERLPQSISNSLRRIRQALFECVERRIAQQSHGAQQGRGA